MTEPEAHVLIEQIHREAGERMQATVTHTTNRGTRFTAIQLTLTRHLRTMRIVRTDEWESVKMVWSLF